MATTNKRENNKRAKPLLWGQSELDDPWFRQPLLEQALQIAKEQQKRRRPVPAIRRALETDPALDDWFEGTD